MKTRERIDLELIDDNPWQPRQAIDEHALQDLVDSIHQLGLLQAPLGRRHPEVSGRVQLAFGHRRVAALRRLHAQGRGESRIEMDVAGISDEGMAVLALTENERRKELSQIEVVRAPLQSHRRNQAQHPDAGRPARHRSLDAEQPTAGPGSARLRAGARGERETQRQRGPRVPGVPNCYPSAYRGYAGGHPADRQRGNARRGRSGLAPAPRAEDDRRGGELQRKGLAPAGAAHRAFHRRRSQRGDL